MSARWGALCMLLLGGAAPAADVTIERATVPWSELERLLSQEGRAPPTPRAPDAPLRFSISSALVDGRVASQVAQLEFELVVEVLARDWTVVPLFPKSFALSTAEVNPPVGRRGLLVRGPSEVSLVVDGAGRYSVHATVEAPMELSRLRWAPRGLTGAVATLTVDEAYSVPSGHGWKATPVLGATRLTSVLGSAGLELQLGRAREREVSIPNGPELEAVSIVSLGGAGVARIRVLARPDASGHWNMVLPMRGRPWKLLVAGRPVVPPKDGEEVSLALAQPTPVELAYTFEAPALGIRGRYRVELPVLSHPVRGARWEVWMPAGLRYVGTQASLPSALGCENPNARAQTLLEPRGVCTAYSAPVLPAGRPYVEGAYDQSW